MKMQLNRDHVHSSTSGLSIEFKADVPTHVPPRLVREVMAIGGIAVEQDKAVIAATMAQIERDQRDAEDRKPKIVEGIQKMLGRNQRGDFTSAGRPNLNILNNLIGLDVTAQELDPVWAEVKKDIQE